MFRRFDFLIRGKRKMQKSLMAVIAIANVNHHQSTIDLVVVIVIFLSVHKDKKGKEIK